MPFEFRPVLFCATCPKILRSSFMVSLRKAFTFIFLLSTVVTGALLITTKNTFNAFNSLSSATDKYISLQETANTLLQASDYLTEEAQCYTVSGDRQHLDNYFREVNEYQNREKAVATMKAELPDSDALKNLQVAMNKSVALMDREYHAMRLVLSAKNDLGVPEAMQSIELPPDELRMSHKQKMELAQTLMHDEAYYDQKELIYSSLESCLDDLKQDNYETQKRYEKKLHVALLLVSCLIFAESSLLVSVIIFSVKLGVKPILAAGENIKRDEQITSHGSTEFTYLADAYNRMYNAYQKSVEQLTFKASHDELTGLYNREGFDHISSLESPERTAFVIIDTDNFKDINDTYGHDMGDKVLKKIARTLTNNFRPGDFVFRIGGDEFVVMMLDSNNKSEDVIQEKITRINESLADDTDGIPKTSISVGVAIGTATSFEELYQHADAVLYEVKKSGKGKCAFFHKEELEL